MDDFTLACRTFEQTAATALTAISAPGYGRRFAGRTEFLHFSPDAAEIIAGWTRSYHAGIARYRLSDDREVARFKLEDKPIAMSRSGALLACCGYTKIPLHRVADGERVAELPGRADCAVFADSDRLLVGASAQEVTTWKISPPQRLSQNGTKTRADFSAIAIAATNDAKMNVTAYWALHRSAVVFYDTVADDFRTYEQPVPMVLAMHPAKNLLAVGGYGRIAVDLFDPVARAKDGEMETDAPCYSAAFSPDGSVFAAGSNKRVELFDTASRKRTRTVEGFHGPVTAVALSATGLLAAGCDDRALKIFDLGRDAAEIAGEADPGGHRAPVRWLAFDAQGKLHSGSAPARDRHYVDNSFLSSTLEDADAYAAPVHIRWDPVSLALEETLAVQTTAVERPGNLLVPAPPEPVPMPDAELVARVNARRKTPPEVPPAVVRSPNGRHWLSLDSFGSLALWLLASEQPIAEWDLHGADDTATVAVFSPDASALYVGTERGLILRFALSSGE